MSNLGWYQGMTTLAKRVGGPKKLLVLTVVVGYATLRGCEAFVKKGVKTTKRHLLAKRGTDSDVYDVHSQGSSNKGLKFEIGDRYRVLEVDNDAVLIEKIGDNDNPHVVSANLLRSISSFDC